MTKLYKYYKSNIETKQTIVCLAGAAEGGFVFEDFIPLLKNYFNIVTFNNPGVDGAEDQEFFTCYELAKQYHNELQKLGVDKYNVLGHCMGGNIAQAMAIQFPESVENLILFATGFGSYSFVDMMDETLFEQKIKTVEDFLFSKKFQRENPDIIEKYKKEMSEHKVKRHNLFYNFWCSAAFSCVQELSSIKNRTLVIQGTDDIMVSLKDAEKVATAIENSYTIILKDVGHAPFTEKPEIIKDVIDFILNNRQIGTKFDNLRSFSKEDYKKDEEFRVFVKSLDFVKRVQKQMKSFDNEIVLKAIEAKKYAK